MSRSVLYQSNITAVSFSITEPKPETAVVNVTSYDLFRNDVPYNFGLYDAHMGTNDHSYKCLTCYNNKRSCLGHEGIATLRYPVWSALAVATGRKWLRIICFNCGNAILPVSVYSKFRESVRLDEASKLAKTANRECVHCKAVHPLIKRDLQQPLGINAEFYEDKKLIKRYHIYPHMAWEIFNKISDQTVISLGRHPSSHPRSFVTDKVRIMPVPARPDSKKMGGARSKNDDITTMYQFLLKRSEGMPATIPEVIDPKLAKMIYDLNNGAYELVKSSSDSMKSIHLRWKGKTGRFRGTQLGKRVRRVARSTIRGDPTLQIDQIRIPLAYARKLQMEEIVQDFNKAFLVSLIQNGRKKYPGATKIIKKGSRAEYDVESTYAIDIENGDTVLRDLVDGDVVNFNRQPSLTVSSISAMRVVVNRDPDDRTFAFNVIACKLFNADFDGDQMSIIVNMSEVGRNEIRELSSATNWFISHTTSNPAMGQVDDSIIGSFELTRNDVLLDKYHASLLFQNTTVLPAIDHMPEQFSGKDCVSLILPAIDMQRPTEHYKPGYVQWVKYDPEEIRLKIVQGKIVSGVLDKKAIGADANGGLYHLIASEFGNKAALEVVHANQQMAISYVKARGFTVGIMDLMMPEKSKEEIAQITTGMINKSYLITERLHNGEIIPPVGKTVKEFYEEQQISALSSFDDFQQPVIEGIRHNVNGLYKLYVSGSKGKDAQLFNMTSAVAQKLINGERTRQKFGHGRTAPYYRRFESDPISRGFITNSYLSGMTAQEYMSNADASRFDLISKALSTSVTGNQNRLSIKGLETIIINNVRAAVKATSIVQYAYSETYLNPARIEQVTMPTVMISDAELEKTYKHPDYPEYYQEIVDDRAIYRKYQLQLENVHVRDVMTADRKVAVNVGRVVTDVINKTAGKLGDVDLKAGMAIVTKFLRDIEYIMLNGHLRDQRAELPPHVLATTWLFKMLFRSIVHPNAIVSRGLSPKMIELICTRCVARYANCLIDPGLAAGILTAQSFSEPLTQYMLDAHHRSASGGTSKSGMTRTSEVLGAVPTASLSSPSMHIQVKPEYVTDKAKVQEIANSIEMMTFGQFVSGWQIFYEKFAEPVHPLYADEKALIEKFIQMNPILVPPTDLIHACLRFVIDKTTIMLKNMTLSMIIAKLREKFPETYIVYSSEIAKTIVVRVYMKNTMIKNAISVPQLVAIKDTMMKTIIRGVDGVLSTRIGSLIRNKVNSDGSIERLKDAWCIVTTGTNMTAVVDVEGVDGLRSHTDAIQEMYDMFGIEAARHRIISSLRGIVSSCNDGVYMMYADEMTRTGRVTSINTVGLRKRERSNVLLRIGAQAPMTVIEEAAVHSLKDNVSGITAPLLLGSVPKQGTTFNNIIVNPEFAAANVKSAEDIIADLF
jgi:DNA-directed RNA polymerase II subunit RPB1